MEINNNPFNNNNHLIKSIKPCKIKHKKKKKIKKKLKKK
jgi:hypothetical protein